MDMVWVLNEGAGLCGRALIALVALQLPGAARPGVQTGPSAKHGCCRLADLSSDPILPRALWEVWSDWWNLVLVSVNVSGLN